MAPRKKTGKEIVKWDEEFAGLAKDATKGMELSSGKFISTRGGRLSFNGEDLPGNELQAVILGWVYENQYYEGKFDPDTPQAPVCYAFGTDTDEMEPHAEAPDKQCDTCAECPLNEWGSADTGKGKACKNVVRLALMAASDLEDIDSAEIVYLKIPVMSVKNFTTYAKKRVAEALSRPYWAVVTTIALEQDNQSQFRVTFRVEEKVEDSKLFTPLKALWEKAMEGIDFPYPKYEEEEAPKPKKRAKTKFARK